MAVRRRFYFMALVGGLAAAAAGPACSKSDGVGGGADSSTLDGDVTRPDRFIVDANNERPDVLPDTAREPLGTHCQMMTCFGCCMGGTCFPGTFPEACGKDSAACVPCGAGRLCSDGVCIERPPDAAAPPDGAFEVGVDRGPDPGPCGPETCFGCCAGFTCLPGREQDACGTGGAPCRSCVAGTRCDPASFTCGP